MSVYTEVSGTVRKATKIRVGVSNIARNVRKGFVGIGGVARPFFTSGEKRPVYYGEIQPLSVANIYGAVANTQDYLLCAAGNTSMNYNNDYSALSDEVTAYDKNLVVHSVANRSFKSTLFAGATNGVNALFAGGRTGSSSFASYANAYDNNLVRTIAGSLYYSCYSNTGFRAGDLACFCCGRASSVYSYMTKYDTNLTRSNSSISSFYMYDNVAASIGTGAIIGGGLGGSSTASKCTPQSDTRKISSTGTVSTVALLKTARKWLSATSVPQYALFVGGHDGNSTVSDVDAYDANFVHYDSINIGIGRYRIGATSLGNFALLGGGFTDSASTTSVECFDNELVLTQLDDLTVNRRHLKAGSIGDFALFLSGHIGTSLTDSVETYKLMEVTK